jgi:hypothetical protein
MRTCLCGPNDENMVVVSSAVKTANLFLEKEGERQGFWG